MTSGSSQEVAKFKLNAANPIELHTQPNLPHCATQIQKSCLYGQCHYRRSGLYTKHATMQGWIGGQALVNSEHCCEPNSQLNSQLKEAIYKVLKESMYSGTNKTKTPEMDLPFGGK